MTVPFANHSRFARCRVLTAGGAHVGSIDSDDSVLCGQPPLHDENAA